MVFTGAKVNLETEKQILRLSELRIIMEKVLIDWHLILGKNNLD
jgi:hypothetical protein